MYFKELYFNFKTKYRIIFFFNYFFIPIASLDYNT